MKYGKRFFVGMAILLTMALQARLVAAEDTAPSFQEVSDLLRQNLPSVTPAELDQAAVQGLLTRFAGSVSLLTNTAAKDGQTASFISKAVVFDESYAYFRIARTGPDIAAQFKQACEQITATNKLKGVVIDLRFTTGHAYEAAADWADQFLAGEQTLLTIGDKTIKSKSKTNAWTWPVMALVNNKTSGAAEAFAAILRETKVALILGATTAGQAAAVKEYPLKNGSILCIATSPIQVAKGVALSSQGIKPDIDVKVSAEDELAYWQDPYRLLGAARLMMPSLTNSIASTNRSSRSRINEAELVRLKKEDIEPDPDAPARGSRDAELAKTVVRDPVLARALDLLKGLAVVQQNRVK